MIKPCKCESKTQDKLHGKGMRVMNFATKAFSSNGGYRCTVCLSLIPIKKEYK